MTVKGNFINGEFVGVTKANLTWSNYSPSDKSDLIGEFSASNDHVADAVDAAKIAFKSWSKLSVDERAVYLNRLKEIYLSSKAEVAKAISRETGKIEWEALGEAGALAGKIDITINASMDLIKEIEIENALPGVTGRILYKPRGVMAVLGPFNFPGHLPNGHFVPALLTGNTVVFKPSELTPLTGQLLAEMIEEAGFPTGVFNMVQGGGDVGKRLVKSDNVDGVLFTGSYETGLKIKQDTASHYWKMAALEMGGKNSSIIWEDTDMDKAVYENVFGSFASSGQRCSCTSRIIVHDSIHEQFVERFHMTAKKIKIGHWSKENFMGPVINDSSVERVLRFQQIAQREGAENLMRAKHIEPDGFNGSYVTPSINLVKEVDQSSVFQTEEIFGPSVAIFKASEIDEAIDIANATKYGLSSAVFSKDRNIYEKVRDNLDVGLINWNRASCGASSKLPFGGRKKSGNGYPSAHFAVYYCTEPLACLEDESSFDSSKIAKGLELV
ncbi:MAG: succinylglutamate-semialdehyde dehydrogenase [Bdellovibrionales bacterium]